MASSKSPISLLQEIMVERHQHVPEYYFSTSLCTGKGFLFEFKCTVKAGYITAYGMGNNKKEAKLNAAEEALRELGINIGQPVVESMPPLVNYIAHLEVLTSNASTPPKYTESIADDKGLIKVQCEFLDIIVHGYAMTKRSAQHQAAEKMLNKLKWIDVPTMPVKVEEAAIETEDPEPNKSLDDLSSEFEVVRVGGGAIFKVPREKAHDSNQAMAVAKTPDMNLEDMILKLDKLGYNKFSASVYQRQPLVMKLKLDNSDLDKITVISDDDSFKKAFNKLSSGVKFTFKEFE